MQRDIPLQWLQGSQQGAGAQHGVAQGAGQQLLSGHVAQPVTKAAALIAIAKAKPVIFIVIYPLDKIDGKVYFSSSLLPPMFVLRKALHGRQRVLI